MRGLPAPAHPLRDKVTCAEQVNALALPGGSIVVFSGLLSRVRSESELAMVLGHEVGHFATRDHLKGLGATLAVLALTIAMLGGGEGCHRHPAECRRHHLQQVQQRAGGGRGLGRARNRFRAGGPGQGPGRQS